MEERIGWRWLDGVEVTAPVSEEFKYLRTTIGMCGALFFLRRLLRSTAHPGDIVNNAKQKRRTQEEIETERLAAEETKKKKQQASKETKKKGIERAAAVEERLRKEDQHARATAARPDLVTAQLKRSLRSVLQHEDPEEEVPHSPSPSAHSSVPADQDLDMDHTDQHSLQVDDDDLDTNSGDDADYVPPRRNRSAGSLEDADGEEPKDEGEEEDDDEIQEQIAAFAKNLRAKKARQDKKATKPKKGELRADIAEQQNNPQPAAAAKRDQEPGIFDEDEDMDALRVARAAKESTAEMGIVLKKKIVNVDVNGKVKQEPKEKFTNTDLPFPADSHAVDLKHFQKTVIPDAIDYAATLSDPFAAAAHPSFRPTVEDIWKKYFTAYTITEAVYYCGGSYRSPLILKTFYSHMRIAIKTDEFYGYPTGAMSLCAAALERAIGMWKTGHRSDEGIARKNKKRANGFIASPWADRAANYLPPISTLTAQKWREIITLTLKTPADPKDGDIFDTRSTDDESSDGYVDPRSCVVVSDDEPEVDDDVEMQTPGNMEVV
ncbi:hypothetical protein C8R43DRAFT_1116917 [Mycena crocata]|nr:hypothetical protein C8R43DRAFT_1116917 [Mycena crocata]